MWQQHTSVLKQFNLFLLIYNKLQINRMNQILTLTQDQDISDILLSILIHDCNKCDIAHPGIIFQIYIQFIIHAGLEYQI